MFITKAPQIYYEDDTIIKLYDRGIAIGRDGSTIRPGDVVYDTTLRLIRIVLQVRTLGVGWTMGTGKYIALPTLQFRGSLARGADYAINCVQLYTPTSNRHGVTQKKMVRVMVKLRERMETEIVINIEPKEYSMKLNTLAGTEITTIPYTRIDIGIRLEKAIKISIWKQKLHEHYGRRFKIVLANKVIDSGITQHEVIRQSMTYIHHRGAGGGAR